MSLKGDGARKICPKMQKTCPLIEIKNLYEVILLLCTAVISCGIISYQIQLFSQPYKKEKEDGTKTPTS